MRSPRTPETLGPRQRRRLSGASHALKGLPRGSVVVPFCGSYLESYKVTPKTGTTMEPMGEDDLQPGDG